MRATPTLIVNDELLLQPAGPYHLEQLLEAFEESLPEVIAGLPWYDINEGTLVQLEEYLHEVGRGGRIGRAHHWAIIEKESNKLIGLVAFDRVTRTQKAHWNLGYWVRKSATRRGIAKLVSNKVLDWVPIAHGGPTAVEITVDPNNEAGLATCNSIVAKWRGNRVPEVDGKVEVAGEMRHHITYLLPRLPIVEEAFGEKGTVWLSLDTDDLCHHPKISGHPSRSKGKKSDTYVMSQRLSESWERFFAWREDAGNGLPVTFFVIAEQLDDADFVANLTRLLSDETITIGCHGNRHRCWSAWPKNEMEFSQELAISMRRISQFAGDKFRPWFRAPGGYIAPWMIDVLSHHGVTLDSSISKTRVSSRKIGQKNGYNMVCSKVAASGMVEREWFSRFGIPLTGPALRIPVLRSLSRRGWNKVTKNAICCSDLAIHTPQDAVDSLYWHLIDFSMNGGKWVPPLHPTLQFGVMSEPSKR